MELVKKQRDNVFDNLKAVLIILVVFGHIISFLCLKGIFIKINILIYSFHMPLFIFITGYFCKNFEKLEEKNIKTFITFIIFNTLYTLVFEGLNIINVFVPLHAYWYLFSMFLWKDLMKYVIKFKFPIILLILLSLYVGTVNGIDRTFSMSRTICFFPFFVMGYFMNEEKVKKIRKISRKVTIPILILTITLTYVFFTKDSYFLELFQNAQSYHTTGVSNKFGIFVRLMQILISMLITICLINICTEKNIPISYIGRKTLTVFLISPFIQRSLSYYIINAIPNILENICYALIICISSTIIIVFICSLDIVFNTYNKCINWIYEKITIKNKEISYK